jgi:transposase
MAPKGVRMPTSKRRKFTKEFKEEAVRVLETDSRDGREVARELGVTQAMLYKWRRQLGRRPEPIATISEAVSPNEKEELRRLRKEVAQLRMDKEILKKAAAFFAKESK